MHIGYKIKDKFDLPAFLSVIALLVIGLTAIYSATVNHPTAAGNFERQLIWALISLGVFFIIYFLPKQTFRVLALPSYAVSILLLIAVLLMGHKVYGARSWMNFGPFGFQPSEFAKISMVLMLSSWLSRSERDINNIKDIAVGLSIGIIPILLILVEPDLGTAIVFIVITLFMIFWSGINLFGLFVVLSPGIVILASLFGFAAMILALAAVIAALFYFKENLFTSASVFVMNLASGFFFDYGFRLLKPHQQRRIETFIDPSADPLGSGYNALQAKVAIGSGGFFGKGFLHGNQTQLRFIPEQWTDFIFCVIGEEFGFLGSMILIILFLVIFVRFLNFASNIKDKFGSLVVIGTLTIFFVHFAINIGMNIGIAPVIGIPLPFVSYGGSSLLANFILLGIVFNIFRNRKQSA